MVMEAERQYEVSVSDIFYIESVDSKGFIYTKDKVYETQRNSDAQLLKIN